MRILVVNSSSKEENTFIDLFKRKYDSLEMYSYHDMKRVLTSSNVSLYNVFNKSCLDFIIIVGNISYSDNIYIEEILSKNKTVGKIYFDDVSNLYEVDRELHCKGVV